MQPESIEMTTMSVQHTSRSASPNTLNDEEHSSLPRRTIESIEMTPMSVQDTSRPASPNTPNEEEHTSIPRQTINRIKKVIP